MGMNKMGLAQDNTIILLKKLQFGENCIFWEKKAILATARVSRANAIMKLGPELHYRGAGAILGMNGYVLTKLS
jgi:hypothetical protein